LKILHFTLPFANLGRDLPLHRDAFPYGALHFFDFLDNFKILPATLEEPTPTTFVTALVATSRDGHLPANHNFALDFLRHTIAHCYRALDVFPYRRADLALSIRDDFPGNKLIDRALNFSFLPFFLVACNGFLNPFDSALLTTISATAA
jgi:hypothetical protein